MGFYERVRRASIKNMFSMTHVEQELKDSVTLESAYFTSGTVQSAYIRLSHNPDWSIVEFTLFIYISDAVIANRTRTKIDVPLPFYNGSPSYFTYLCPCKVLNGASWAAAHEIQQDNFFVQMDAGSNVVQVTKNNFTRNLVDGFLSICIPPITVFGGHV